MLLKSRKSALKWRGGEEEGGERGGERERDKRKNFEGADPKLAHVGPASSGWRAMSLS